MANYLAYIGLGSNLAQQGDTATLAIEPPVLIKQAINSLADYGHVTASKLYRSKPMGPQDQPDYYNAACALETNLAPLALLDVLQQLEQTAGRVRLRHWGERTLDLDLLAMFELPNLQPIEMQTTRLTLPHVGVLQRSFVVVPLLDLAPTLKIAGQALAQCDVAQDDDLVALGIMA